MLPTRTFGRLDQGAGFTAGSGAFNRSTPAHTPGMEIAALQHLAVAMRGALAELFARASSGERSADLRELAQHVRELLEILVEGLAELSADPSSDTLRDFARALTVRLTAIERELAGARLQELAGALNSARISDRVERAQSDSNSLG